MTDKAITLQDSPEIGEEGFGGEEEDGASDDEGLNEKLCTFAVTQKSFMTQYWYALMYSLECFDVLIGML